MAKKSTEKKVSAGNSKAVRIQQEAKRQEKIKRAQEKGRHYEYKPNPYKKGSNEYEVEAITRIEKAKSSRCEYAWCTSQFAKLDHKLGLKK